MALSATRYMEKLRCFMDDSDPVRSPCAICGKPETEALPDGRWAVHAHIRATCNPALAPRGQGRPPRYRMDRSSPRARFGFWIQTARSRPGGPLYAGMMGWHRVPHDLCPYPHREPHDLCPYPPPRPMFRRPGIQITHYTAKTEAEAMARLAQIVRDRVKAKDRVRRFRAGRGSVEGRSGGRQGSRKRSGVAPEGQPPGSLSGASR
jgi:hypothetical protein